jgi:hypothetical protein
MFLRTQRTPSGTYLLLVENARDGPRVRQRILHRFGRLDELHTSGQLDGLLTSLGRFADKVLVLGAHNRGEGLTAETRHVGGPLVFERLWEACGIRAVLTELLSERRFTFPVERAIFLTVLHRLLAPGSDRAAERWKADYTIAGTEDLELHHLYRAMAWLGRPVADQTGAGPLAPRTMKDVIEERLFARRRDLFTQLTLAFFDTTSIYFEGHGGETLGQYGHSKDHRPDRKQLVVGLVLDGDGYPVCSEVWPGNTTDITTLEPIAERLQAQFQIQEVCLVADRGMISAKTIDALEARRWSYVLGVRMRAVKEAHERVLVDHGSYQEVFERGAGRHGPAALKVKEVVIGDRRYIVCVNEDQRVTDQHDREAIVAALRDALTHGDKSLVGNKGYRKYLKTSGARFAIDEAKVEADARYDGVWVLRTNTALTPMVVALAYKHLWMVEAIFRSMKSLLNTRPVYHKYDATIRGHVFCSFLALLLRKELQSRLARKQCRLEWPDIMTDLDRLQETRLQVKDTAYVVRSQATGVAGKVFQACGVALPPVVRPC